MARAFGSLRRLSDITAVVARHGLGELLDRRRTRRAARLGGGAPDDPEGAADSMPASGARFRAVLEELGPTFIKFGQVLSTRADLLPPGFAEALRGLQDHCAPMEPAQVQATLSRSLGPGVHFAEFDTTPLASASIGQVHRARLPSGEQVAVKVQRPNIRAHIIEDVDLLRMLAELAEAIIEESGMVTPRGVVSEFEGALLRELDFVREAEMMRRFGALARKHNRPYVVPRVYDQASSPQVLTMDFMQGAHMRRLTAEHDRRAIAKNFLSGAIDQLFVDGLFHADPHPGNFFILEDSRIALLDYGSVGQISFAMREALVMLVLAVGMRDAGAVARLLYRVGEPEEHISLHKLRDAIASLFDTYLGGQTALQDIAAGKLLGDLFSVAARFRVRLPSEYALVSRATITVEGIIRQLDPELELAAMARPVMKRLLDEQFSLPELGQGTIKNLLRGREMMRELPLTLSQILMDLEGGVLRLQVQNPKLDTIARNIDALGVIIFMGLVAGGLVTGSLFALARYDWELFGLPLVPTVALYLASMLFGAALGRFFLSPRVKKLSLGRWLARRRRRGGP